MSAPSSRYLSAISRPRPVPPPVTRMRLPLNNPGWNMMGPLPGIFARALPGAGRRKRRDASASPSCPPRALLLCRPEHSARGPVGFLDVAHNDLHRARLALEHAAGFARNAFDEFALEFGAAAFEHIDLDQGHDFLHMKARTIARRKTRRNRGKAACLNNRSWQRGRTLGEINPCAGARS